MASPSYEQILSFGRVSRQLLDAAVDELMEYVHDGMTAEELVDAATHVAAKYSYLGCELGAQWYDLCSELAGIGAEPAEYGDPDLDGIGARAEARLDGAEPTEAARPVFNAFLQDVINDSIRMTGNANLHRDYERGICGGKWTRVPVGDTCAWCLMLASQGAWYVSERSALNRGGIEGDHYHDGCDCKAVYHADAESIGGYSKLDGYKKMYYDAENRRLAAHDPSRDYEYPEELAERIAAAKAQHEARSNEPWTQYNETLIVMRYEHGLK